MLKRLVATVFGCRRVVLSRPENSYADKKNSKQKQNLVEVRTSVLAHMRFNLATKVYNPCLRRFSSSADNLTKLLDPDQDNVGTDMDRNHFIHLIVFIFLYKFEKIMQTGITVVPTKCDSDVIFCLQLLSKTGLVYST